MNQVVMGGIAAQAAEDFVGYHELVKIASWSWTSSGGQKAEFELKDRDELAAFDSFTTKRRSGKQIAGQRFQIAVGDGGEKQSSMVGEGWFLGHRWVHTKGALVTFEIDAPLVWNHIRELGAGAETYLTLVQIADDERPINQEAKRRLEAPPGMVWDKRLGKYRVKGGRHSKHAGQLCHDPGFVKWLETMRVTDEPIVWVRDKCRVESLAYLDDPDDPAPWERFTKLVEGPFLKTLM